jgi:propionate CoA-transferase
MAEVSRAGDVNVSSFPGRSPGCGGFIDISQSARKVVFVGTFSSGGLHVGVGGGGVGGGGDGSEKGKQPPLLSITSEGRHSKFKVSVGEVTFAGSSAKGREIVYVTERAVFRLREEEEGEEDEGEADRVGGHNWNPKRREKKKTVVELCEVAPGIDLEKDVLSKMAFRPAIARGGVKVMSSRVLEGV